MKRSITKIALIAMTSWMTAGIALASDGQAPSAKPASSDKAKAGVPGKVKAPTKVEPVDINSASKEELKKLPGIGDIEADRIIAGRPYLTKAHLQTHNVIPAGTYQGLSQLVVAKQKDAKFTKEKKK